MISKNRIVPNQREIFRLIIVSKLLKIISKKPSVERKKEIRKGTKNLLVIKRT